MGEKTGLFNSKLEYDFPTEGVLEVQIKGNWYRVSSRHFRSFDGKRRITQPVKQPGLHDSFFEVPTKTWDYNGPVYIYFTNRKVPFSNSEILIEA